ncbi:hypothetical protein ZWY2020_030209 [Hordeum vulgare]|nr:hypothetical protein ZWY2020_030209 [Hordeum vulgare]
MGKRRRQECDCGKRRRKHLYLVLDDWDNGFSLHKMDALSLLDDSDDDGGRELERLPDPPAVRITEARQSPMLFAGLGTSIFVANKIQRSPKVTGALVYDTETAAMAMGPAPPENTCCFFVAVSRGETKDEKLYTLGKTYHRDRSEHPTGHLVGVSVHALSWARSPAALAEPWLPSHEWAWESVAAPTAPFDGNEETVVSYAVHPDGHTIFFSTKTGVATCRHLFLRHEAAGVEVARGMGAAFHRAGLLRKGDRRMGRAPRGRLHLLLPGRHGHAGSSAGVEEDGAEAVPRGRPGSAPGSHAHLHGQQRVLPGGERGAGGCRSWRAYGGGRGCALHVTVFGLKYNREGEVQATLRRVTKSYAVPSTSRTSLMKRSGCRK